MHRPGEKKITALTARTSVGHLVRWDHSFFANSEETIQCQKSPKKGFVYSKNRREKVTGSIHSKFCLGMALVYFWPLLKFLREWWPRKKFTAILKWGSVQIFKKCVFEFVGPAMWNTSVLQCVQCQLVLSLRSSLRS